MPTLNSFIRSTGAAIKRAERNQQRKAREAAKRYKAQLKLEAIENAAEAVNSYNEYVDLLQSMHKECTDKVDWNTILYQEPPQKPLKTNREEYSAKAKLDKYRPSFLDRTLGLADKKIRKMKDDVLNAKRNDHLKNEKNIDKYESEYSDWVELNSIAIGIDKKEIESYIQAIEYFNPFSDIGELGTKIEMSVSDTHVDIDLHVNDNELIPNYELRQTSTGKLSKKKMSKSNYNLLYQDYVCSCLIRVAREIFAYLPIEIIRISAIGNILNSKTGFMEDQPIVSVNFTKETVNQLNLDRIDPSDSMSNFVHNMSFIKTKGFRKVEKVNLL